MRSKKVIEGSKIQELQKAVSLSKSFRPAAQVFRPVESIPTIFPQYDHALRVGGHPLGRIAVIHGPSNHGKALAFDMPVLTDLGWKPIGELTMNDRVIGSDGMPHKLKGIYPQGIKKTYTVTFSDGASVDCCDEHLWYVFTGVTGNIKTKVMTLGSIRDDFIPGKYRIPIITKPVEFAEQTEELSRLCKEANEVSKDRKIVKITPSREIDCVCISIDSANHLFVTKDFIVTHNTTLGLGLGLSFLQANSYFLHIDAEMTTPVDWLRKLMGEYADSDRFLGYHPETYEGTTDAVREFIENLSKAKADGSIDPKTSALILVDSLRKLIPQNFFAKIAKKGSEESGVDGFGGRGAQMKAALNSAWMDELVPLLHKSNASMVIIARESEDVNADANDRKYGRDYKVTGGNAVIYDSSLVMRVERTGFTGKGKDDDKITYGERHRVTVNKTKIASKSDRKQIAYFHSSNGNLTREGFDTGRDLLELGKKMQIVKMAGAWYQFAGKRVQGEDQFLLMLQDSPEIMRQLNEEIRNQFESVAPEEEPEE